MQTANLNATPRKPGKKSELKQSRRDGFVPAVLYGSGGDAQVLEVETAELQPVLKQSHGTTLLIDLKVKGTKEPVKSVIRNVQRHPTTRRILHCDLLKVDLTRKYHINVPIVLTGEAIGVKTFGGVLTQHQREVEILCLPTAIPESYSVDISDLEIGDSVRMELLELKGDEEFVTPPDVTIASVSAPRVEEEKPAEEVEAEEAVEGEEGEAAEEKKDGEGGGEEKTEES